MISNSRKLQLALSRIDDRLKYILESEKLEKPVDKTLRDIRAEIASVSEGLNTSEDIKTRDFIIRCLIQTVAAIINSMDICRWFIFCKWNICRCP